MNISSPSIAPSSTSPVYGLHSGGIYETRSRKSRSRVSSESARMLQSFGTWDVKNRLPAQNRDVALWIDRPNDQENRCSLKSVCFINHSELKPVFLHQMFKQDYP